MKNIFLMLAVATISSANASSKDVQTSISEDGQKAIYFLSQYCVDALKEASKTGAWIGQTSYSGDWTTSTFTVSYAMFRQSGFVTTQSAGTIELKSVEKKDPPADGSSMDVTCTYN